MSTQHAHRMKGRLQLSPLGCLRNKADRILIIGQVSFLNNCSVLSFQAKVRVTFTISMYPRLLQMIVTTRWFAHFSCL